MNLGVASEFIEMAAHLIYIKSRMLLPKEEVEEAFFIPLRFENKVLLGEKSELAKRRKLLKELILNPTEEETFEQTKSTYNLTDNEITYIVNSRKTLTTIKQKVLKK